MKAKWICLLLALAMLVGTMTLLVACGGGEEENQENTQSGENGGNQSEALGTPDLTVPATNGGDFVYDSANMISGLTDAGKGKAVLTVPADAVGLNAGALAGATALKQLVLGNRKGAFIFMNGSLDNVAGLEVYINCSPDLIGAPSGIAATGVKLCIGQAYYNDFKEHYSWSALADFMQKFDAPAQDDENGGAIETPIVDIPAK